jgi:hypothetical protein
MGPQAALMDAGENARALAATAYLTPGKGKEAISKYLTGRQVGERVGTKITQPGQARRIIQGIDDLVPEQYHKTKAGLANENKAGEFYRQAYAGNKFIESSEVDRILKTPAGKQALKEAAKLMRNDMKNVSTVDPNLTAALKEAEGLSTGAGVGRGLKLETLDYVKRALQDVEKRAQDQFGKPTEASRIIGNLKRKLTKALDSADETGAYSKARKLASDKFANQAALKAGREFMSNAGELGHPEALKEALADMSEAELHHFRIGVAEGIKGKLSNTVNRADGTKQIWGKDALEQKIELGFGSDKLFQKYIRLVLGEEEMFKTHVKVLGNSKTAEMQAALQDAGVDPGAILQGAVDIKSGGAASALRGVLGMVKGAKGRATMPAPISREVAKILTQQHAPGLNKAVGRVKLGQGLERKLIDALIRGEGSLIGSEVGQITGRR